MLTIPAPAKINLSLRVLGKRADGFHEIETVFARLDLADELIFEAADSGISMTCSDPSLSCGEDNLVGKAARALQQAGGISQGARIHLIKRVPIAAGLGGGSSDAASTLLGLTELWKLRVSSSRLMELAAGIGSDVPFFLCQAPYAIGRGRGERCEPVSSTLAVCVVLVVPRAALSTKAVYEDVDRDVVQRPLIKMPGLQAGHFDLTASAASITMVAHALRNGSLRELAQALANDLAPAAIRRCPVIARIQTLLRDLRCLGVCLSGSGPAVFGLCTDERHAQDMAHALKRRGDPAWRVEVIHAGL